MTISLKELGSYKGSEDLLNEAEIAYFRSRFKQTGI